MSSKPPWMDDEKQAPESVVVGTTKPHQQMISGQPTMGGTMLYVQDPKFNPEPNFRNISYVALALAGMVFIVGWGTENFDLGSGCCCGLLGLGLMLDATHYGTKATWQKERGESSLGSTIGLIADILIGIAFILFALVLLADELL